MTFRISLSSYHVWSEALSSLCSAVDFVWYLRSSKASFVLLNVCAAWWEIRVCKLIQFESPTLHKKPAIWALIMGGMAATMWPHMHGGGGAGCCMLSRHDRVCVRESEREMCTRWFLLAVLLRLTRVQLQGPLLLLPYNHPIKHMSHMRCVHWETSTNIRAYVKQLTRRTIFFAWARVTLMALLRLFTKHNSSGLCVWFWLTVDDEVSPRRRIK
jgi:hypothetical protein